MIDVSQLPALPQSILVTRLDSLGDIVLGTMLLSGLHAKWPAARIVLIVRPGMKGVAAILPEWAEVVVLPFDPRESPVGHEAHLAASLRDFAAQFHPDLAVVAEYNRTWAGEILADICGAPQVLAFDGPTGLNAHHRDICSALGISSPRNWMTVHAEADARESTKYAAFLAAIGLGGQSFLPDLLLRDHDRDAANSLWEQTGVSPESALVCFPGSGSLFARSLDPAVWSRWIARLATSRNVVLLGSALDEPVLEAISDAGLPSSVCRVIVPVDEMGLMASFIVRAATYVGMDTGPTHIAAALGLHTLAVFGGGHRAERFLPVGRKTSAVRMPIGCYGCEWICPFDRRLCIKEIPEQRLIEIGEAFLQDTGENPSPFAVRVIDIQPPPTLPAVILGPIMVQHRRFLQLNHDLTEHHAYLADVNAKLHGKVESLTSIVVTLARHNHERNETSGRLSQATAEMSEQNRRRDEAIAHLSGVIAEMSHHNLSRDAAIAHLSQVIAEMSNQNLSRDGAIQHINDTLADMTRQNEGRDRAISAVSPQANGANKK